MVPETGGIPMDAKDYNRAMGARLQKAIEARGHNQTTAADVMGWNPSRICDYVRGHRAIRLDVLDDMIRTLDLDPRILFSDWSRRIRRAEVIERIAAMSSRMIDVERSRSIREYLVGIGSD
jgi:hypothetical protein